MAMDEVFEYKSQLRFKSALPDFVNMSVVIDKNARRNPDFPTPAKLRVETTQPTEYFRVCVNPRCHGLQLNIAHVCKAASRERGSPNLINNVLNFLTGAGRFETVDVNMEIGCEGREDEIFFSPDAAPCPNFFRVTGHIRWLKKGVSPSAEA